MKYMKWTLTSAAAEFQTTQETLRKRLAAKGHKIPKRGRGRTCAVFTMREISEALTNEKDAALVRKLEAETIAIKRRNREALENLIAPTVAQAVFQRKVDAMCRAMDDGLLEVVSKLSGNPGRQAEHRRIICEYLQPIKNQLKAE